MELANPTKAAGRCMEKLALECIALHQKMEIYSNIWDHGETSKTRTKTQNGSWMPVQ
jgi:hypothetical protein